METENPFCVGPWKGEKDEGGEGLNFGEEGCLGGQGTRWEFGRELAKSEGGREGEGQRGKIEERICHHAERDHDKPQFGGDFAENCEKRGPDQKKKSRCVSGKRKSTLTKEI